MFLIYFHNCLCSVLLYFTRFHLQSSIFTLIHFTFLCIFSLRFTLCFAFLIPFLFNPPSLLCSYPGSLHVFAFIRFILPYFALFSLHLYSVCFALLRFFTLSRALRFTSFRIALCFPYFSWSSFRSGFNFTSSWNVARPSIPCSTCFVEPRAILLPLIPLCPSRVNPGLWRNPSRIDGAM